MKYMYHATSYDNLDSILQNGILARNAEKVVYLCETSEDAAKFVAVRGIKNIITFKVKIYNKDMDKFFESFDHSQAFFKCRAYGYMGDIPADQVIPHMQYELPTN